VQSTPIPSPRGRRSIVALCAPLLGLLLACCPAAESATPELRHYEISASNLPKPYATPSASSVSFVIGRPSGAHLTLPPGFEARVWASSGMEEPRMMALAPNGDVFVSDGSAGKIHLFRDADHDGVAEQHLVFASDLSQPFGLAFQGGYLYVGNTDAVVRFRYTAGQTKAAGPPERIITLPGGGHWTRNLLFSPDGTKLYVSVGSASNVSPGEPPIRAAISEYNADGSGGHVFASGIRNPVGLARNPVTLELWTAVNERDGLGDDLPPDYVTSVHAGAFFGWPYAYTGQHEDPRHRGKRPDLVQKTLVPDVLIQAHSAALGITFYQGKMFPAAYSGDAFVALHGSWNRSAKTGYKIIRIPFHDGKPAGGYDDFMTGWMTNEKSLRVWGRPVGLLVLADGSLLVSDDGASRIWRVTYGGKAN